MLMENAIKIRQQELLDLKKQLRANGQLNRDKEEIGRAKKYLMEKYQVDEVSAYHTMRKMAMNSSRKIVEVARAVLMKQQLEEE